MMAFLRREDGGGADILEAYNAILAILDATDIDLRVNNNEREKEDAHNQDSWDLESLNSSIGSIESG
jgi:hypothetical protein